jgi:RNA processing factor Prp31
LTYTVTENGLVDVEGLRKKLQDRIQEMRTHRHADESKKRKEYKLSLEPNEKNLPKKKKQKRVKNDETEEDDSRPNSTNSTPTKSNISLDEVCFILEYYF